VGSVCGVSNADVAKLLNAPVLVVGRPGVGNAIDAMNYIISFFNSNSVAVLGGVWNKIPTDTKVTYHSYDKCKHYVTKYFKQTRPNDFSCYGFIPLTNTNKSNADFNNPENKQETDAEEEVSCRLRAAKTALIFSEKEKTFTQAILKAVAENFDIKQLMADIERFYGSQSTPKG
jgi:hypothetical protein